MYGYAVVHVTNYSVSQGVVFDAYLDFSFERFIDFCIENAISYTISLYKDFPSVNILDHVDNYTFFVRVDSNGM